MISLRTPETQKKYDDFRAARKGECPLCREPAIKQFMHWKLIPNAFPYDRVAEKHDMLVPLRHIIEEEFTEAEKRELLELKKNREIGEYMYMIEAFTHMKTIPEHFHLHLLTLKEK